MSRDEYAPVEAFTGNGLLDEYSFSFKIEVETQLQILVYSSANVLLYDVRGDDTTFIDHVEFDEEEGGGTVYLQAVLATGRKLRLVQANDSPTQPNRFRGHGSFTLKAFEMAMDWLGGSIQRASYLAQRSIRLHVLTDETLIDMTLPPDLITEGAGRSPMFNTAGDGWALAATWPLASDIATASQSAIDAAASAAAALASENAASGYAASATASASAASASASAAAASAVTASAAASSATASAASATASASSATTSASTATTQASNASASAANASASASSATTSASTATTQATNANNSAIAAAASAAAALVSELSAANSAALAAASVANVTGAREYATDAAFVSANGSAEEGDLYFNTTDKLVRFYDNTQWRSINSKLAVHASDAAYVTANGTAVQGDFYFNTTTKAIRFYDNTQWRDNVSLLPSYANDAAFVTANGTAVAGDVYMNTTISKPKFYSGSAWSIIGSGGGAAALRWYLPDTLGALRGVLSNGLEYFSFGNVEVESVWAQFVVPASYVSGTQCFLKEGKAASVTTSGNVLMRTNAYILKQNIDMTTVPTPYTSTNAQQAVDTTTNELIEIDALDLTSSTGTINSVAIAAGDTILVNLFRAVNNETSGVADSVKVLCDSFELVTA